MSDVREPVPEAEAAAELPLGLTACLGNHRGTDRSAPGSHVTRSCLGLPSFDSPSGAGGVQG